MRQSLQAEYRAYFVSNARHLWPGVLLSVASLAGSLLALRPRGGMASPAFVGVYAAAQAALFGGLGLLFYFLLRAPTAEGRKLLDAIAGYREGLATNVRGATGGAGASPFLARHLPYAMALGIECDRLACTWASTAWFTGRSGGFSVRDFVAAFRRRLPGAGAS
jgi:hypothetical protein